MPTRRGMADVMDGVIEDLRGHQPLLEWLEEPQAIDEGWPNEADSSYPVEVLIQVVWDGSTNRGRGATRRNVRVQCSVVATAQWWQSTERTNPSTDMAEILDRCADRLDKACGATLPGVVLVDGGGMGSSSGMEADGDNRRVAHADWRFRWTQIEQPDN